MDVYSVVMVKVRIRAACVYCMWIQLKLVLQPFWHTWIHLAPFTSQLSNTHLLSLSHKYTHTHKNTFSPVTRHSDSCCSLRACLRVWYLQKQLFCCISTSLDLSCKLTFIQQKKTTGTENTEQRYRGSCRKKNNKILNATVLTKKENGQNDIENANHFNPVFNCKCSIIEILRMK